MTSFNFSEEQKIEFRDVSDLGCILYTHSVAPHKPGELGSITPSTLLYVNETGYNSEIYYLYLKELHTKLIVKGKVIHTEEEYILDMCFDADKQLMVAIAIYSGSSSDNQLSTYNTETGKREWNFYGKLPEMEEDTNPCSATTNGHGHLFVSDSNNKCIQMFRVLDGGYLGCLVKDDERLGCPDYIRWCEKVSSLVVACRLKETCHLNVINVKFSPA